MIIRFPAAVAAAMLASAAAPAAVAPQSIDGRWVTQDRDGVMEIAPCGAARCGRLVKILKGAPDARDRNNPDRARRNDPVLGMTMLRGFAPEGERWHGRIYDPRRGRLFNSYAWRAGDVLNVRGCLGPICQTQRWTRLR